MALELAYLGLTILVIVILLVVLFDQNGNRLSTRTTKYVDGIIGIVFLALAALSVPLGHWIMALMFALLGFVYMILYHYQ